MMKFSQIYSILCKIPDWSHDVNVTVTTGLYSDMSKMQLIILYTSNNETENFIDA